MHIHTLVYVCTYAIVQIQKYTHFSPYLAYHTQARTGTHRHTHKPAPHQYNPAVTGKQTQ